MTDPLNTTSVSPPSDALEGELVAAASETNTLYVLPGDVLLVPVTEHSKLDMAKWQEIHDAFELDQLCLMHGINQPWILRKGTPIPPSDQLTDA